MFMQQDFVHLLIIFVSDAFYVTWGAREDLKIAPGAAIPPAGKPLGLMSSEDFMTVVEKGLLQYSEY